MINEDCDFASILVLPPSAVSTHISFMKIWPFRSQEEVEIRMNTTESQRTRAVFSPDDFSLIRVAVGHYLSEIRDRPDSIKFANLYHRLGRILPKRG